MEGLKRCSQLAVLVEVGFCHSIIYPRFFYLHVKFHLSGLLGDGKWQQQVTGFLVILYSVMVVISCPSCVLLLSSFSSRPDLVE